MTTTYHATVEISNDYHLEKYIEEIEGSNLNSCIRSIVHTLAYRAIFDLCNSENHGGKVANARKVYAKYVVDHMTRNDIKDVVMARGQGCAYWVTIESDATWTGDKLLKIRIFYGEAGHKHDGMWHSVTGNVDVFIPLHHALDNGIMKSDIYPEEWDKVYRELNRIPEGKDILEHFYGWHRESRGVLDNKELMLAAAARRILNRGHCFDVVNITPAPTK